MPGGDTCDICSNASKYRYIMEELVQEVKELKIDIQKRDTIFYEKLEDHNRELNNKLEKHQTELDQKLDDRFEELVNSLSQKEERQFQWKLNAINITVILFSVFLGALITWILGKL